MLPVHNTTTYKQQQAKQLNILNFRDFQKKIQQPILSVPKMKNIFFLFVRQHFFSSLSVFFLVCDQLLLTLDPQAKTMCSAMLFAQFPVVLCLYIVTVQLPNGKWGKVTGSFQTSSVFCCRTDFPCYKNQLALTRMSFHSVLSRITFFLSVAPQAILAN